MNKEGILIVVSGFSGAGKGTIMKALLERYDNYALSISATTRNPRPGEEEGKAYFFKTTEEFEKSDSVTLIFQYVGNYNERRSVQRSDFITGYEAELNLEFPESSFQITEFYVTSRKPGLWYKLKKLFRKKG